MVDLEEKLPAALEKIENLKLLNENKEQHHQASNNPFATRLTESIKKREAELEYIKEELQKSKVVSQRLQKSSSDLENILSQ